MPDFRGLLAEKKILVFDGGLGTLLQEKGMPPGSSPELFGFNNTEVITEVHSQYMNAGADVLTTNTFGGTEFKLGANCDVVELNRTMAELAKKVAGNRALVAGSVGPTGKMVRPLGDISFSDMIHVFKRQIKGLVQGGVDLILGETHFDLAEVRALVIALRELSDVPVAVSMTFENGVSLTGTSPETFVDTMQNMGVDCIATNCSSGPEGIYDVAKRMMTRLHTPLLVEPNAGLPQLVDQKTVYNLSPAGFAEKVKPFIDLGVQCIGGCCGTTPDHIQAIKKEVGRLSFRKKTLPPAPEIILTSRSRSLYLGGEHQTAIIGERINPTGKEGLTKELQSNTYRAALRLAEEQEQAGAKALDVNVGAPMVDEPKVMAGLVQALTSRVSVPLCLDSSDSEAIQSGLLEYPGSPLVNSISGEEGRMEVLGPLCKKFGAPFILLPIKGKKLPVSAKERLSLLEKLLLQLEDLNIPRHLAIVDVLALTISSKPEAARVCLEVIRHCNRVWNLPTTIGLSNISFGLPARELINSTFLSMAVEAGLSACIANPDSSRIQETLASSEVLMQRDIQAQDFIASYASWSPAAGGETGKKSMEPAAQERVEDLKSAVIHGQKERVLDLLDKELDEGRDPFTIVNQDLIPAISRVGDLYERREYFLPQLLMSAETMQTAFFKLQPLLEKGGAEKGPVVVMATVEGDIHDIGKNIVCLMLKNYGFTVVDMGKDVTAKSIVESVKEHNAPLVGLSALMTTTMVKMEEVVIALREAGLATKVMVGGAVLSELYANQIGADGYAPDAVNAVKLAEKLVAEFRKEA